MNTNGTELIYGTPKLALGSELSESDMLTIATSRYPNKKYITPKHWMIIDILGTESELKEIRDAKKPPSLVYYSLTCSTISGVLQEEIMSYSDYQISYIDGFFETEETVYLLMNKGFRKNASARLVSLLNDRTAQDLI